MLDWSEREAAQMGITLAILGLIFMSDEVLFKFLKSLGLHEEEKNKTVATAAAATAMDPELLDLFEGDAKKFVNEVLVGR